MHGVQWTVFKKAFPPLDGEARSLREHAMLRTAVTISETLEDTTDVPNTDEAYQCRVQYVLDNIRSTAAAIPPTLAAVLDTIQYIFPQHTIGKDSVYFVQSRPLHSINQQPHYDYKMADAPYGKQILLTCIEQNLFSVRTNRIPS
jgi:hypothetical protein